MLYRGSILAGCSVLSLPALDFIIRYSWMILPVIFVAGPMIHFLLIWAVIKKERRVVHRDKQGNVLKTPVGRPSGEIVNLWGKPNKESVGEDFLHRHWKFYGSRFELMFDKGTDICTSYRHESGLFPG